MKEKQMLNEASPAQNSEQLQQQISGEPEAHVDPFLMPKFLGFIATGAAAISYITHPIPALKEVSDVAYNEAGILSIATIGSTLLIYKMFSITGEVKPIDWKAWGKKLLTGKPE